MTPNESISDAHSVRAKRASTQSIDGGLPGRGHRTLTDAQAGPQPGAATICVSRRHSRRTVTPELRAGPRKSGVQRRGLRAGRGRAGPERVHPTPSGATHSTRRRSAMTTPHNTEHTEFARTFSTRGSRR